ncbi:MAG TPA: hypothetical protein VFE22_04800 [Edaphobacter sp.]|nr:hypothetical protein [Edaphobacter sp.]
MREARAHLELQGELTGELNGTDATDRQVIIVVPAMVPAGANVPLAMKVSEEGREVAGGEGPVIDVPVEGSQPSRWLLLSCNGEEQAP